MPERARPRVPRTTVALTALTATTVLAGCSGGTQAAGGDGPPRTGGTLTYAVGSDLACADPQQAGNGDELTAARGLADSLTDQDPATGRIVPWLATKWRVDAKGRSYTFTLRRDVTFSDGGKLDARAVKESFDGVRKLGAKAVQASTYLTGFRRAVVVGDNTVRFEFDRPNAQFLQATSSVSLAVVSPATARRAAADRCAHAVVGSGPFTLDRFAPNQQVVQRARKGYAWPSDVTAKSAGAGRARLDRLVFKVVPETGVRVGGLQSGQFDAVAAVPPQNEQTLKTAGLPLLSRPVPGLVQSLNVNTGRPATKDPDVRRALQKAVDRAEIVRTVYTPDYRTARSALASTTPHFADVGSYLATDRAAARDLLDRAGWRPGADGVRTKDGKRLALTTVWFGAGSGPAQSTLELVQQQLKGVGVALTIKTVPLSRALETFKTGAYDLALGNASTADPDILRNYYTAKGLDVVRLGAGPLRSALYAQSTDIDPKVRGRDLRTAQRLLVEDAYAIPLYESRTVIGVGKKVHGVTFDAASRPLFATAWLS
ncbi:ABC transporter substrate-binding protein [Streptomyces sp. NPDC050264]|uniref:ABC transporter substrate-binding protein n=1 Tax=Streptomyces sp. NPDC050264 TaxID=3155038 RepID=UPI003440E790